VTVSASQATKNVQFSWNGLPANKRGFITQCRKSNSDPTFVFEADCSNLSEIQINPVDQPGYGTVTFPVFHGAEPSGDADWGCFAASETAPSGITKLTTCYLRITVESESNKTDAQVRPITFTITP